MIARNTYTKAFRALAILSILSAAFSASANTTNTVPFGDSFEGYSNGQVLAGTNGWYGNTNSLIVASNYTYSATTKPLASAAHTKIVALDTENGALTNRVNHTTDEVVYIDLMLDATPWTDESGPASITNDPSVQFGAYLNSNGQIVVYGSSFDGSTWSNQLAELNNTPIAPSNEWIRLTVTMTHASDASPLKAPFFAVQVNGSSLLESAAGYSTNSLTLGPTQPGPWHVMPSFATTNGNVNVHSISEVAFSGTGLIDDFVVTNAAPSFVTTINEYLITRVLNPLSGRGGFVTPTTNFWVQEGANATNVFTSSNYWDLAYVVDNGTTNTPASAADYVITNVTAPHTVTAYFTMQTLTNNTPRWWLATYGTNTNPTDADALEDSDGDGKSNWEEWLASTDPLDSNKVFEIATHYIVNGTNVLEWVSDAVDPDLGDFQIVYKTNMNDLTWTPAVGGTLTRTPGVANFTNTWTEQSPVAGKALFYRITATN